MSDELKGTTIPTLTLDPFGKAEEEAKKAAEAAAAAEAAKAEEPAITLTTTPTATATAVAEAPAETEAAPEEESIPELGSFSPEEIAMIEEFAASIDVTDSTTILQYGASAQQKLAEFSEKALDNVRTQDLGEVGSMLATVVAELQDFDKDPNEKKGFLGLFKKGASKIEVMRAKYEKTDINIDKIVEALEAHQIKLMKDIAVLEQMYALNLTYFKELSMYIAAGKKRLAEIRRTKLAELVKKAQESNLPEDAQAAKDLAAYCDRFEKKLYDLELSRTVAIQTAPQIRLIQDNNTMMIEKIQSTIVNTIPLWKNQMVIALGIHHAQQAAQAQNAVTNLTNELLAKNAEALHEASVATAKEAERGVIDMETLVKTNEQLIGTLDEVLQIQKDGRQKRLQAEADMAKMEAELKKKLLEINN